MAEVMNTESRPLTGTPAASTVPTPRSSPENGANRRHRAPTLGELIENAITIIRRDSLGPSGFLVVQSKGTAKHQHSVWELGPFALLDDGWFGQVHGRESSSDQSSRWLHKHERKCREQHWTQFHWIDPAMLDVGCGAANIGLALSSDGPTYCPGQRRGEPHPTHIPLVDIFKQGLRKLALEQRG
ncbi:hypothetical protein EFK50_06410 [Nocardioides marmoriginsengisoli]|uniref:Uncharacterized protein n=1 Tax=Nocardioides marmoriginsengisoli TaxID=661483 RepID=A0A3N0CL49_9ACTN|nr:hypothetical protein [Nocardioides marmoriginsengisoli]RNL64162.1 hypothetical protein EFK50_06410 [Nocardioides marmoriginsengisoli]